ncbi:MAG TPA: hypothetical protein VF556_04015 [Pyrinomonadaceae bacterium]
MRTRIYSFFTMAFLAFAIANVNEISAQVAPYRVSGNQVQTLLNRLETRTDNFRREIDRTLDNSRVNGTRYEENIAEFVTDFENATDRLRNNFASRNSTVSDVQEVLDRAMFINEFMRNNRFAVQAQNQWNLIRNDLNLLANYYNVNWTWSGRTNVPVSSNRSYTVSDASMQSLLARIEQRTDVIRRDVDSALRGNRGGTRYNEDIAQFVSDFENATDSLRRNFDERDSVGADVEEVLRRASFIDSFIRTNRLSPAVERQWSLLRSDLNTLASNYRVNWNWNNTTLASSSNLDTRLTGTYRLNINQSDNVNNVVDRAITSGRLNANQQDRVRRNLERRLTPPDMLAIEKRGQQVTIASTLSPQGSFTADNVSRSETNANGRTVQTRATATSSEVTLNYEGDRINDFYVSFTPLSNGQLRVTRRVYLENTNTSVTAVSVYDKTANVAQWSSVDNGNWSRNDNGNTNNGNINNGNIGNGNLNDFVIPNNTRVTATLRDPIDTKVSQNGDRFQLEVTSPSQYRGAVIEGRIANADQSGRVSGRASLSMEFDTIRLPNGQSYRFAGFIDSVRATNGDNVQVNNEGTVRDNNQTTRTVTRAGIGAVLGGIIGAIAGGGQGAAIGAAIGAGAGAGTVILQGRDNIELGQGSEFTITASAPSSVR